MVFELEDVIKMVEEAVKNPLEKIDDFLDNRWNSDEYKRFPYYRLFYQLAKRYEPGIVVELGGWQGTAAAHFAAGSPKTSHIATIDHHTDPGDERNIKLMLEAERKYSNLFYLRGWTIDEVAEEQKGKHALGDAGSAFPKVSDVICRWNGIDILFIDSWHQYEYAKKDWEAYKTLLNSPALVICDDIIGGHGPGIGGMEDFWKELPGEKYLNGQVHPGYPMGFMKYEKDNV